MVKEPLSVESLAKCLWATRNWVHWSKLDAPIKDDYRHMARAAVRHIIEGLESLNQSEARANRRKESAKPKEAYAASKPRGSSEPKHIRAGARRR